MLLGITALVLLQSPRASAESVSKEPPTPIIVAVGGFGTCLTSSYTPYDMDMYSSLVDLINFSNAQPGAKSAEWIIACHTKSNYRIKLYSSRNPNRLIDGNADNLIAEIEALAALHRNSHEVLIVGHSYGGWASMLTTINLADWVNVRELTTLDPISAEDCQPLIFIAAYLNSMGSVNAAPGCIEAPEDLRPWFPFIKSRVKIWRNYYQAQYLYLHSDRISGVTSNTLLEYITPILLEFQAHQYMDQDSRVWAKLRQDLLTR
jgi:pimeloyl-ACP methyl ester carboxylesterase